MESKSKEELKAQHNANLKNTVYDFQYKLRLPFRFVFFTVGGMITLVICYMYFENKDEAFGMAIFAVYPIFKLVGLKNHQVYDLPIVKIIIKLFNWIKKDKK